jgi:hypothetical protein
VRQAWPCPPPCPSQHVQHCTHPGRYLRGVRGLTPILGTWTGARLETPKAVALGNCFCPATAPAAGAAAAVHQLRGPSVPRISLSASHPGEPPPHQATPPLCTWGQAAIQSMHNLKALKRRACRRSAHAPSHPRAFMPNPRALLAQRRFMCLKQCGAACPPPAQCLQQWAALAGAARGGGRLNGPPPTCPIAPHASVCRAVCRPPKRGTLPDFGCWVSSACEHAPTPGMQAEPGVNRACRGHRARARLHPTSQGFSTCRSLLFPLISRGDSRASAGHGAARARPPCRHACRGGSTPLLRALTIAPPRGPTP